MFLSFSDRGYEISPLLINFRKIPAGKNAKNSQTKIYARPIFGWIKSGQPKLNPPEKKSGVDFCFWVFLTGDMKYPCYWSTLGRFPLEKNARNSQTKIYARPIFRWIKGSRPVRKVQFFFNIVQKAFDPPPLSFEHHVVNFSWKFHVVEWPPVHTKFTT